MYSTMLRIRMFEEVMGFILRGDEMLVHLCIGREAVNRGAPASGQGLRLLQPQGHGHCIARAASSR